MNLSRPLCACNSLFLLSIKGASLIKRKTNKQKKSREPAFLATGKMDHYNAQLKSTEHATAANSKTKNRKQNWTCSGDGERQRQTGRQTQTQRDREFSAFQGGHFIGQTARLYPRRLSLTFCSTLLGVLLCQKHAQSSQTLELTWHTPNISSGHPPPNSVRFSYATEGVLFISAQLSSDAVSALRKVRVLIYDCRSNLAPKHARKHETHPPRVKKKKKKEEFRLDSNDCGFICAGVNFVGGYKWHALFHLSCL